MNWKIAEAKQRFSELIHAVTKEPQLIYNRNELVAVVVKELRQIVVEEDYILEVPSRQDRLNPFADAIDDFSL
jgi:prevent-host-death family protein